MTTAGATAAALLDARALEKVLEATAGAAADGADAADGGDEDDAGDEAATPTGWMAAPLIRRSDGFDAELLLAALRPAAEARYLAVLAASRGRPTGLAAPLLDLLARSSISISERMVALEALGTHGAAAEHAAAAVDGSPPRSPRRADGGARCRVSRACSWRRRAIDGGRELRAALGGAVGSLAVALEKDHCRYARAHAAEALASIVVAHAAGGDGALDAAAAFAAAVLRDGGGLVAADVDACAARAAAAPADAHACVRWLCARRRCPLTTPTSPF